jgi:predicted Zn-dependent protease
VVQPAGADTLVGEAEALASVRPEQAVCLIGLIAYTNDLETFGAVVPESKSGVINVAALAQGAEEDPALLAKRVSKESVNAALLLNGLQPCPNPRCALFTCADLAGIDQKGFGACPPCLYRYLDKVKERGMTVRPLGQ